MLAIKKCNARTVVGRGENSLLCVTPDLSYDEEGENRGAKMIIGMEGKKGTPRRVCKVSRKCSKI